MLHCGIELQNKKFLILTFFYKHLTFRILKLPFVTFLQVIVLTAHRWLNKIHELIVV